MNNIGKYNYQPRIRINQEIKIKNNNNKNNFMILLNSYDISYYQILLYVAFYCRFLHIIKLLKYRINLILYIIKITPK
jgi:hypothetical protein